MNPWNIIQQLESDNSTLAKQQILKDNIDNAEFIKGSTMCLDPLVTFGVKQVPEKKDPTGEGLPKEDFEKLVMGLQSRYLTGHAARDAILVAMAKATQEEWNDVTEGGRWRTYDIEGQEQEDANMFRLGSR